MKYGMFDLRHYNLDNGIELVTIKKETQITSIHGALKIGSIYEDETHKGISHFIEHMLFKGTETMNNEELNCYLEQLGGEYNAYTGYNCTVYSITALMEETEEALRIMSSMIIHPTFPMDEIEKERGVILSEINTGKDDLENISFININEFAFKKSPLKFDTLGTEATVKSFTGQQLIDYYNKYYIPNNCCISIVSPLEHEQVLNLVNKYFSKWDKKQLVPHNVIQEKNIPGKKITRKKEIEQSTITYLYTFYDLKREGELALKILSHKLGESANCILFRKLREERGLAYDVYSEYDMTNNVKTFYIYTSVNNKDVQEASKIIEKCIEDIKQEKILYDDKTIELMKKVLKTAVISTIEETSELSNYIIHQLIDGDDMYQFINDMNNLNSIRKEDIYDVARSIFNNPTVHILMPEE